MKLVDRRLLGEARKAHLLLAFTIGLGFLGGLLAILQARALSQAIDQVFLGGQTLAEVRVLLTALLLFALARASTIWGSEVAAAGVASRVKSDLRERLFSRLLALGPAYARGERTGELTNTAVEGTEALDAYFGQYLPQLVLAALVPLAILVFVFPLDPISGLVLLLTAPLIPIFMVLIGDQADAMTRRQWTSLSRMSAHFLDVLQGLPTLKMFNRSREQLRTIGQISDRHRLATMGVLRVAFLSALVLEMVATISTALVAVEVGLRLLYGQLAFEQAFFILILAPEFYLPLRLLGARFHAGVAGVTAATRIFEILDACADGAGPMADSRHTVPGPQSPTPAVHGTASGASRGRCALSRDPGERSDSSKIPRFSARDPGRCSPGAGVPNRRYAIAFHNVFFSYPGESRLALEDVSFDIQADQKVALVGPSGGGKSTVAQLLLRFVEPAAGEITVDGVALDEIPVATWRSRVSWVPQLPYLFNASVVENIRLGCAGASVEEVARAAQQAGAHDFIRALSDGYDTVIGERGARLSGGQAQRITLARAFLRDASLVILDEATANLDPETEAEIQASLDRLLQGRAALVIAHRLNTVCRADEILVFQEGRIVERGTHEALLAERGTYCQLVGTLGSGGALSGEPLRGSSFGEAEEHGSAGAPSSEQRSPFGGTGEEGSTGAVPQRPCGIREQGFDASPREPATSKEESGPGPLGSSRLRPLSGQGFTPHVSRFTFHVLAHLLSFLAPFWPRVLLSVLLGFAAIACGIGLMGTSAWVIASAALGPSIADLQVAIVGVRFFGIARGLARYGERLASHDLTFRVLARLRVWFYGAIEPLAPARLMTQHSGDLLSRIVSDVSTLENFYLRAVAPAAVALLIAFLAGLMVGRLDVRLALNLLFFLALGGLGVPVFAHILSRRTGQRLAAVRGDLSVALVDGIQGMADLLAFGSEGAQHDRLRALSRKLTSSQRHLAAIGGLSSALLSLCTSLAVLTTLLLAIPLVTAGQLTGVSLAVLVMVTIASFEAVLPLPAAAQVLESSLEAGRRLLSLVVTPPLLPRPGLVSATEVAETTACAEPAPATKSARTASPVIAVKGLRFRYGQGEPWVLNGISFEASLGKHLAIVGPSGSGKSTLVNLLVRFWDYEEGEIRLEGEDLRRIDPEAIRQRIAVVTQNPHLFSATIRDNLLLARPDATEPELDQAVGLAQLDDFVRVLSLGYDTWAGESGLRLSSGERQRLAIARAILKDASILLLDEATANLDPLNGRAVLEAVRKRWAGRTLLMITHNLAGVESADEILVIRQGAITEQGHHDELLKRNGLYLKMWQRQRQALSE